MQKWVIPALILFVFSHAVFGQTLQTMSENITDVLAQYPDPAVAKKVSHLEDRLNSPNTCHEEMQRCEGFRESLLPEDKKKEGWETLFEIKYRDISMMPQRPAISSPYKEQTLLNYYGNDVPEDLTAQQVDEEAKKISDRYKNSIPQVSIHEAKSLLILKQIQNTTSYDQMMKRMSELTQSMDRTEYVRFISFMANWVDYNDRRSEFVQKPGAGLGTVGPFDQIVNGAGGICGDIHSMAAKLAEQRGWEAFTVGYAMGDGQHIVTALVDPKEPNKLMVVNYKRFEETTLNDGNSLVITPTATMQDMGIQMRIFKNDGKAGADGRMGQLATIPTALGSFMNDLFKKDRELHQVMPANENYRAEKVTFRKESETKDGMKEKDVIIYEGETGNAQVFGVAVSKDTFRDIYRWDPKLGKCVLKKNKYFSTGLSNNLLHQPGSNSDSYYAYLNIKGGQIIHLYQTEKIQFKGVIGYELSGFAAFSPQGGTGDANLAELAGFMADYKKNGTSVHLGINAEAMLALRNQNLYTDLTALPTNIAPMRINALSLDASIKQRVSQKDVLYSENRATMTNVGGRVFLSTGLIHKNTEVSLSYQGGIRALPLSNNLKEINLLQNFNDMDGVRVGVAQKFSNKQGTLSGSFSGYGGVSTSTERPMPMAGATLKINLNRKKK